MAKEPPPEIPPSTVVPLGDWIAIIQPDKSVILQHQSQVPVLGTEVTLDLTVPVGEELDIRLTEIERERLAVRTVMLMPDGSVWCDQDAISPAGEPESPFQVFDPTHASASRYFQRKTGKGDW